MAAERDLERRIADALHDWLDAEPAPQPRWESAPARSRQPRRAGIPAPLKLLAVAALVAGAVGGAVWAGGLLRDDAVPTTATVWCAPVEAYPPTGTRVPQPSPAPWPEVGPEATASSGVLAPGEVAVLARGGSPSALVRVSNPRICDRYPTYRPRTAGTRLAVMRLEVRALEDGALAPWMGGADHLALRGGRGPAGDLELVFGVPGVWHSSSMETPAGYEWASDVVFAVAGGPADDLFLDYRLDGDRIDQPPLVSWAIGPRPEAASARVERRFPDLSGPVATGRLELDEWAVLGEGATRYGVRVGQVEQVERYPAAAPARGAFLEVMVSHAADASDDEPVFGPHEWRAVDGSGEPLEILDVPPDLELGVLNPLYTNDAVQGGGWLAIDAPPEGRVVLEYRRDGEGPVLADWLVRDGPVAPAETAGPSPVLSAPPATTNPTASPETVVSDATLCASFEDYGVPGEATPEPTLNPFPSVAPDASPTTGELQPGDVAVIGDAAGPGAVVRVGDVRFCDRYPTARPDVGRDRFVVVHLDLEVLRSGFLGPWTGAGDHLLLRRPGDPWAGSYEDRVRVVPGVDVKTSLRVPAGFTVATDVVYAIPGGPAEELALEWHASSELPLGPAPVSWALGTVPERPVQPGFPGWTTDPELPPATGRIGTDEVAIVETEAGRYAVIAARVDEVAGYPGVEPERGRFVEVWIAYSGDADIADPAVGSTEWRPVTSTGEELPIRRLRDSGIEQSYLKPQLTTRASGGWLVIDAPPEGEIVLEYRRGGEGPVLFEVLVRAG